MQYTFELIMAFAISFGIILGYMEIMRENDPIYVSICCQADFREIPKKDDTTYLCFNCKKWCKIIEEGDSNAK